MSVIDPRSRRVLDAPQGRKQKPRGLDRGVFAFLS
jgi:hypothetical protein